MLHDEIRIPGIHIHRLACRYSLTSVGGNYMGHNTQITSNETRLSWEIVILKELLENRDKI